MTSEEMIRKDIEKHFDGRNEEYLRGRDDAIDFLADKLSKSMKCGFCPASRYCGYGTKCAGVLGQWFHMIMEEE